MHRKKQVKVYQWTPPMRFQYEIHPDKRMITEHFQGQVTLKNLMAAIKQLNSDPMYSRHYDGVVDLTDARMEMGFKEVFNFVEFMKNVENCSLGNWAFIAEDPLNFGVMRIFHSLTEEDGMGVKIFRKPEDARAWQQKRLSVLRKKSEQQRIPA